MTVSGHGLKKGSAPSARRKRRSTREIIDRIIDAAFLEFSENGYSSATTAAIARRAEVTEALIFTNFGSKANLFRKAVFKPLDDHFLNFLRTYQRDDSDENTILKETRAFVSELVRFIRRHAGMFKSLVVNEAYAKGDEQGASGLKGLQDYFDIMSAREESRQTGPLKVASSLIARISFATIMGCVIFDDWLFDECHASEEEIHEGICDFIMDGLNVNSDRERVRFRL